MSVGMSYVPALVFAWFVFGVLGAFIGIYVDTVRGIPAKPIDVFLVFFGPVVFITAILQMAVSE